MNNELSTHRWFAVRATQPQFGHESKRDRYKVVQIGGALKTEIHARNIGWVRGFI
jgi:hypothetical protein